MSKIFNYNHTIACIAALLFTINVSGQKVFTGGLTASIIASQIDGDDNAGFNKAGLGGGGFVNAKLNDNASLQMEMVYAQKGSRKKPTKFDPTFWVIRLNYIEIPITYQYHFKKLYYEGGLSYGRLISQTFLTQNGPYEPHPIRLFKDQELGYIIGISYELTEKAKFSTRYCRSLVPIRDKAFLLSPLAIFGGSYNSVVQFSLKYNISFNGKSN